MQSLFHVFLMLVAVQSCLFAGVAGLYPSESKDVHLYCWSFRWPLLRRADHSFRGTPTGVCVFVFVYVCVSNLCDRETSKMR